MKEISFKHTDEKFIISASIGGMLFDFKLVIDERSILLNRQTLELLILNKKLTEIDFVEPIKFDESFFEPLFFHIKIWEINLDGMTLKNVYALNTSETYSPNTIGLGFLDKLGNWSITKSGISIMDENPDETIPVPCEKLTMVDYINDKNKKLSKLKREKKKHPEEDFLFDYWKWGNTIWDILQDCKMIASLFMNHLALYHLNELQTIIQNNLDDDIENPLKIGSFLTEIFYDLKYKFDSEDDTYNKLCAYRRSFIMNSCNRRYSSGNKKNKDSNIQ